jgi:Fe/S biogenesis protein NfuA
MITITDVAKKKVAEVSDATGRSGDGLRVAVRNGGTFKVSYALDFVGKDQVTPGDVIVDVGAFKIHIDAASAPFLKDASIDYVDGLTESGFKVEAPNSGPAKPTGPVADAIQKVIEERINPAVASHGGWVALVGVQDNTAFVQLGGGCQGCGMVNVTLKQGIEVMIKEAVPHITQVLDTTDHAGGQNPYYQPSK